MTIKRLHDREAWIMDSLATKISQRREGQHLTDAIFCNIKAFGAARLMTAGYEMPKPDSGGLLRMSMGVALGSLIEETSGGVSQLTVLSTDDDSKGTLDLWFGNPPRVVEIKVTWQSSSRTPESNPHWMEQVQGYTARTLKDGQQEGRCEMWIFHMGGDGGAMHCANGHDRPDVVPKRLYEPTGKKRMCCPECWEWLVPGNREPEVRCWEKTWPAEELRSLHKIQTARLALIEDDIKNPRYQIGGELPPIRHGFQAEFECKGCIIKERIGCPGIEEDLTGQEEAQALEAIQ